MLVVDDGRGKIDVLLVGLPTPCRKSQHTNRSRYNRTVLLASTS